MIPPSNAERNRLASIALVRAMAAAFPEAQASVDERGNSLVRVPPKDAAFGWLEVHVDDSVGYKLWLGRFTVDAFEFDLGQLGMDAKKEVDRVVAEVVRRCSQVMKDEIVFYDSVLGTGGYFLRGPIPWSVRFLKRDGLWVWSGRLGP